MSDEITGPFDGDSHDPVEPIPAANPDPDHGHEPPPQGPPQEDTQRRIYPTDPTGAEPGTEA